MSALIQLEKYKEFSDKFNSCSNVNSRKKVLLAAEPYTLSSLLLLLGEGAITYIGGQITKSLLSPFFSDPPGIKELFEQFIIELLEEIKAIIDENALRENLADFEAAITDMKRGLNDMDAEIVKTAASNVTKVNSRFKSLNICGFHGYVLSKNYQIVSLILIELVSGKSQKKNISNITQDGIDYFNKMEAEWVNFSKEKFSPVWGPYIRSNAFNNNPSTDYSSITGHYNFEGHKISGPHKTLSLKFDQWADQNARNTYYSAQRKIALDEYRIDFLNTYESHKSKNLKTTLAKNYEAYKNIVAIWKRLII